MKVNVTRKDARPTYYRALFEELERLFQENKDLRVSEGHLRDEVKSLQNAYELQKENAAFNYDTLLAYTKELEHKVTRYIETNNKQEDNIIDLREENAALSKRIVDLESALDEARANLEIAADSSYCDGELEEQLDHYKKAASIWQEKAEAIQECREDAEKRLQDVSNRFIKMYQENQEREQEAREVISNLRDELNDRNARVDELEQRIETIADERDLYIREYTEMKSECNYLRDEIERLTYERDTAVKGNNELIEENIELRDNLDAVINIKNEYAETIDEMRKKIIQLQSPEFTKHLTKLILECFPSTDK